MVHLNLFSRKKTLLPLGSRVMVTFLFLTLSLSAEILPFFNPLKKTSENTVKLEVQGFIADDPVSLKDFFDDWEGDYSPKNGDNAALEMARIDLGTVIYDGYYVGYFYQRDALVKSNRGFVDGYHAVKNKLHFSSEQYYDLALGIEGIERHGAIVSKDFLLYETDTHHIHLAGAAFLSYDFDTQSGKLTGDGTIHTDDTYSAAGRADYYFMKNLLYDGWDVDETYGIGYGFHIALLYENSDYNIKVKLLANDLFSRTHWKNLPHSLVDVQTDNQTIGDDGYVEYEPSISGWETYRDFTQKISPKYHVDISKYWENGFEVEVGYENVDFVHMPYISLAKVFNEKKVELLYEHRFHSIGMTYTDEYFHISILSNGFSNASAIGISGSYVYHF
jgi:hypothetical protein